MAPFRRAGYIASDRDVGPRDRGTFQFLRGSSYHARDLYSQPIPSLVSRYAAQERASFFFQCCAKFFRQISVSTSRFACLPPFPGCSSHASEATTSGSHVPAYVKFPLQCPLSLAVFITALASGQRRNAPFSQRNEPAFDQSADQAARRTSFRRVPIRASQSLTMLRLAPHAPAPNQLRVRPAGMGPCHP